MTGANNIDAPTGDIPLNARFTRTANSGCAVVDCFCLSADSLLLRFGLALAAESGRRCGGTA